MGVVASVVAAHNDRKVRTEIAVAIRFIETSFLLCTEFVRMIEYLVV